MCSKREESTLKIPTTQKDRFISPRFSLKLGNTRIFGAPHLIIVTKSVPIRLVTSVSIAIKFRNFENKFPSFLSIFYGQQGILSVYSSNPVQRIGNLLLWNMALVIMYFMSYLVKVLLEHQDSATHPPKKVKILLLKFLTWSCMFVIPSWTLHRTMLFTRLHPYHRISYEKI